MKPDGPMEILCLIPARGGSRGIQRKNVRAVAGCPLVGHTIRAARETDAITRVVVSTDDREIDRVAREFGAEVVWRPHDISGETASSESALLHALAQLQEGSDYRPDLIVFLQPTSPLRQHDDVQNAVDTLISSDADSLFSACVQEGFVWRHEGRGLTPITYDYRARPRRQDAPQDLVENGSIYVFKPWVLEELGNRLGGRIAVYRMSVYDSFQIDEPGDLDLMEALFAFRPVRSMPDVRRVELLAMDFDGVMTDNRVLVDQDGREAVWANRSDGLGIARLREAGVQAMVISTEVNPVVAARCDKLGVDVLHGCEEKLAALQQAARQRELTAPAIAYVGNDLNDIECLQWTGAAFAVADAAPEVQAVADFVTRAPGGHGAIREVCDIILAQRGSRNG